ncbi:hypothetical protein ABBQ32_011615 [Trebouxia sp. C0010 RCD-2024]
MWVYAATSEAISPDTYIHHTPDPDHPRSPQSPTLQSARGTGWDFQNLDDLQALQGTRWWYNWSPHGNQIAINFSLAHSIEYVPMQWGKWGLENLSKEINPKARHLLGMNEPGHQQQANLEPAEAAALWPQMETVAHSMGLRLGTPSPAPCGTNCVRRNPFQWFDEFFAACKGCHFDFLATHLYTCNAQALRWYLNDCKRYHLPIWLTEFSCPNGAIGPASRQLAFMADAIQVLDQDAAVERYAWFAPRTAGDWLGPTASLLQADKSELTQLGKMYASQQGQAPTATTADEVLSWSKMCSECFLTHLPSNLPPANRQLCVDCGFHS